MAVISRNANLHGTGFVVKGGYLDPSLGDELLILKNAHVVSGPPEPGAASLQQATVQFELFKREGARTRHLVQQAVWQSPSDQHDVAVLRVHPPIPEEAGALTLFDKLPTLSEGLTDRLYIIGHPSGREVRFSFEDNKLLDYELAVYDAHNSTVPCRIHYRAATEPGSSGSPVFDVNWRIIGIHHAGGHYGNKLNNKPGVYEDNEGLWIETIRRAMQKEGQFRPRSS